MFKYENQCKWLTVSGQNIYNLARKFERLGTIKDAPKSGRPKASKSKENVYLYLAKYQTFQIVC